MQHDSVGKLELVHASQFESRLTSWPHVIRP